jgi:hypothetical protein
MQFDARRVIEALNAEWRWILPSIEEVVAVSCMGSVLLSDGNECHWRVCPEELSTGEVANQTNKLKDGKTVKFEVV